MVALLDGFETTRGNISGKLPQMVADAGFDDVDVLRRLRTRGGTLAVIAARR